MKEKRKFIIIIYILIILLAILLTKKEVQNDLFYTIKIGEDILKYGIDFKDHYSITNDLSYTYPHWFFDLVISLMYKFKNMNGIYYFTIFIYGITGISMFKIYEKLTKNTLLSAMFSISFIFLLQSFITSRAQSISYICFLFEIYFIYKLLETNKKRYSIALFLTAVILANTHIAMFPMYFVFFLPFLVESLISKWITTKDNNILIKKEKNINILFKTFIISIFSGLLTPLRLNPYTYFFKTLIGNSMDVIAEHQPINISSNPGFFVLLGMIFFFLIFTKPKVRLSDLFLLFGLSLLTLLSKRSYALFLIIGAIPMIRIIASYIKEKDNTACEKIINILMNYKVSFIFPIMIITGAFIRYQNNPNYYIDEKKYPTKVVEFIKKELDIKNIRLWNEYNYGSYLLFNDIKVFIDSRADLYTKEFNKGEYEILDDYMNTSKNYKEIFKRYGITHAVVDKTEKTYFVLRENKNNKVLYEDDYFVLYQII